MAHIQELLGYRAPEFPGSNWIPPLLATVVFLYGGLVFLNGARRELNSRLRGMMTLISFAIAVAFIFSWVVQLSVIDAKALRWELATLVAIMLLGHWRRASSPHGRSCLPWRSGPCSCQRAR